MTVYEILTKKIPYEGLDPMMAAMRIVGEGLNPGVPDGTSPQHAQLLRACFVHRAGAESNNGSSLSNSSSQQLTNMFCI